MLVKDLCEHLLGVPADSPLKHPDANTFVRGGRVFLAAFPFFTNHVVLLFVCDRKHLYNIFR